MMPVSKAMITLRIRLLDALFNMYCTYMAVLN